MTARARYTDAGQAMRDTLARAMAADLSSTAWRVLAALLVQIGSYSRTEYPVSEGELAGLTDRSKRVVRRGVSELLAAGVVDREHVQGARRDPLFRLAAPAPSVASPDARTSGEDVASPDGPRSRHRTHGRPPHRTTSRPVNEKNYEKKAAAAADINEGNHTNGEVLPQALVAELDRWHAATGERLTPNAVAQLATSWRENALGTAHCMTEAAARPGVTSRPGLLLTMLQDDDHLAGAPESPAGGNRTNGDQAPAVLMVPCAECEGTIWVDAEDGSRDAMKCLACDGTGRVPAAGADRLAEQRVNIAGDAEDGGR
jgi:hypothetical protein